MHHKQHAVVWRHIQFFVLEKVYDNERELIIHSDVIRDYWLLREELISGFFTNKK